MKKWELIDLVMTCGACPEQYDAFLNGKKVGYLRLRHGIFTVDCMQQRVYMSWPDGDGIFKEYERKKYLNKARKKIFKYLKSLERI